MKKIPDWLTEKLRVFGMIRKDINKLPCTFELYEISNCPFGWGFRIHRLHHCRGVSPPLNECPGNMTLNNLMARFQ